MQAAVLTFFSFIGFEDILNVSEEVKNPPRNFPLGLVLAMTSATLIYIAVAVPAVYVVPWHELASAPGPLAVVLWRSPPGFPANPFFALPIFSVPHPPLLPYSCG